jgi:hypothetical protein
MSDPSGIVTLVVGNFDDAFRDPESMSASASSGMWQKVLWRARAPYVLIAPERPDWLNIRGLPEPARTFPRHGSFDICRAMLRDEDDMNDLYRSLMGYDAVRLMFQVYSPALEELVESLRELGLRSWHGVPNVSSSTVAYWNTKIGGSAVLNGIEGAKKYRPASTIAYSAASLDSLTRGLPERVQIVVKPNVSLGGVGMELYSRSGPREPMAAPESTKSSKCFAVAENSWPRLVELIEGDLASNCSTTWDFDIVRPGDVALVGAGEQLLDGGLRYRGCHSLGHTLSIESRQAICEAGSSVAIALSHEGYVGPLNLDFVVTPEEKIALVEMNVRQSAPMDQFLVRASLERGAGRSLEFWAEEDVPVTDEHKLCDALSMCSARSTSYLGAVMATYPSGPAMKACIMGIGPSERLAKKSFEILKTAVTG